MAAAISLNREREQMRRIAQNWLDMARQCDAEHALDATAA
jgi:hypothetical protein